MLLLLSKQVGSGGRRHSDFPNCENEEEAAHHYRANGATTLLTLLAATTVQWKLDRRPIQWVIKINIISQSGRTPIDMSLLSLPKDFSVSLRGQAHNYVSVCNLHKDSCILCNSSWRRSIIELVLLSLSFWWRRLNASGVNGGYKLCLIYCHHLLK